MTDSISRKILKINLFSHSFLTKINIFNFFILENQSEINLKKTEKLAYKL